MAIRTMMTNPTCDTRPEAAPAGFVHLAEVIPDAIQDIRYYSSYNFVGERINGYERPVALLTVEAAKALQAVSDDVKAHGYRLKIFDAYRPQRAVAHFKAWAQDANDTRMKPFFYPNIDKSVLFANGYIVEKSGHSRGSTVDLTLIDMAEEKEIDMGGTFDWFGVESHPDWCGNPDTGEYIGAPDGAASANGITAVQFRNRLLLRQTMLNHGFKPIATEWWHFTLVNEPYPDTYFDFPVK